LRLRPGTPGRLAVAQAGHYVAGLPTDDARFTEIPPTAEAPLTEVPHQRTSPAQETAQPTVLPRPASSRLTGLLRDAIGFPRPVLPVLGPARTVDGQVAAFFDVDNTLVHGTTLFRLAKVLYRQGFFHRDDLVRIAGHQVRYSALGEQGSHVDHLRDRALSLIAGHDVRQLVDAAEQVYREDVAQRLYAGTTALVQAHQKAGHQVWLVTATPVEMAQVLVEHLGATGCLATVAERADGRYTGRLVGEPVHGPAKARAIRDLADRTGLDLAASYAYGDSGNDLPVLTAVGHPAAVNPDLWLRRAAAKHQWPRYDFRTARRATVRSLDALAVTAAAWWTVGAVRNTRKNAV
jgi:HAD superfamily hydrolase (TIGR01490 family)